MKLIDFNATKGKSKQIVLFLFLTTAFIIFLLMNTKAYHFMWNEPVTVSFTRTNLTVMLPPEPSISSTTTLTKPNIQKCSFKYLSIENRSEGRKLLNNVTASWPETAPLSEPFSLSLTTSSAKSSFTIVPRSKGWRVGDELTVKVQLRDYNGNPKKSGRDFLISKLHNPQLGAAVVGQVEDHSNGTFTVVFPLLWNGTADVEVRLVHASESITVLKRVLDESPDRISFRSFFKSGKITEKTICNVCLDPDKGPLCNLTDPITGEQWFCYKPKTLDCNTRATHGKEDGFIQTISKEEETLFQKGINMKALIKALEKSTVTILPKAGKTKKIRPEPAGYYYGKQWQLLGGHTVRPFNNASAITACLKEKRLHMFGDSTIRQFYTFITGRVPNLLKFDKGKSYQCGPFMAVDHTNDIIVTHRCHGPPIRSHDFLVSQLKYVANELDRLAGGPNTVVVIGVWAHFGSFTLEAYYQRLMTIVKAVQRLLNRAPGTKVIIRTANMRDMTDLFVTLTNSDWYALQLDKVLRAVFKNMDVFLLDAWDMVQAGFYPHDVHPHIAIIKQMIDMILSYTCPKK